MSDDSEFDVNWKPKPIRRLGEFLFTLGVVAVIVALLFYVDSMRPY